MEFFEYDNNSGMLLFNDYHILLIPEFGKLYSNEHNKCKEDKKGINKIKAKKEFAYMWLNFDRKSPYWQYSEHERHAESLADSGLTQEEFLDPDFQAACKKYLKILDSDRILKMIRAAMNKVDDITDYFNVIVDFNERDANGKPIYKVKDVLAEIERLPKILESLQNLELLYAKGLEQSTGVRGDQTPGFLDL